MSMGTARGTSLAGGAPWTRATTLAAPGRPPTRARAVATCWTAGAAQLMVVTAGCQLAGTASALKLVRLGPIKVWVLSVGG